MKLLKFSRPNCPPCVMMANYLADKGVETENFNVYDENDAEVANQYNIQTVPVLLLLDSDGTVVDSTLGYKPEEIDQLTSKL